MTEMYTCSFREDILLDNSMRFLKLEEDSDLDIDLGSSIRSSSRGTRSRRSIVNCETFKKTMMTEEEGDDQSSTTVPTVASSCNGKEDIKDDIDDTESCRYSSDDLGDDENAPACDDVSLASCSIGMNCVSFDLVNDVYEIPSRREFTAEEIEATWYGRREKEVMREAAYGIAESLDYDYFEEETSTRFRGLETYTHEGTEQRRWHKLQNLVAVLREQRRQRVCGEVVTNGPELLQAVCHTVSEKCQQLAYIQGQRDERDARGESGEQKADESPSMLLQLTQLLRNLSN